MNLLEAKLREGTEVLRTGGSAKITARECGALLDLIEATKEVANDGADYTGCPALRRLAEALDRLRHQAAA